MAKMAQLCARHQPRAQEPPEWKASGMLHSKAGIPTRGNQRKQTGYTMENTNRNGRFLVRIQESVKHL